MNRFFNIRDFNNPIAVAMDIKINEFHCIAVSKNAPIYRKSFMRCRLLEYAFAYHCAQIKENDAILDIGNGGSLFAPMIALDYPKCAICTVDNRPEVKLQTKRISDVLNISITHYTTDAIDLSAIKTSTFDIIFSISVVEHLEDWQKVKAMMEAYRVLKPGGKMIMTFDYRNVKIQTSIQSIGKLIDLIVLPSGMKMSTKYDDEECNDSLGIGIIHLNKE